MLNLTKRLQTLLIRNKTNNYCFSKTQEQHNSQVLLHKAILAQKVISLISNPSLFQYGNLTENQFFLNDQYSLRQKIIKFIQSYNDLSGKLNPTVETVKKQILSYFQDGVKVDKDFCEPEEFVEYYDGFQFSQAASKKLHFCPSQLVTGKLFRRIMFEDMLPGSQRYQLIIGQFGIGKSFSALLYKMLSDHIYRYIAYYKAKENPQKDKLQDLYYFKGPKLIYCIINPYHDNIQSIERKILKQCFQFEQSIVQNWKGKFLYEKDGSIKNGINLKEQYYKHFEIRNICIMYDNINSQASVSRLQSRIMQLEENFTKQQVINELKKQNQKQLDMTALNLLIQKNKKITLIRRSLFKSFQQILYLSSVYIQQSQQNSLYLRLNSYNRTIKKINIQFPPLINKKSTINDTIQLMLLEYQKTQKLRKNLLLTKNINLEKDKIQYSKVLNIFKNQLRNQLIQSQFFITPFYSHLFMQMIKQKHKMPQNFYSNSFLQQLSIFTKQQFKRKIINFLQKDQNKKIQDLKFNMLFKIMVQAFNIKDKQNQAQTQKYPYIITDLLDIEQKKYLLKIIDKNLFQVQNKPFKLLIRSRIPSLLLTSIFYQISNKILDYIFQNQSQFNKLIQYQIQGPFLQILFRQLLNKKQTNIKWKVQFNTKYDYSLLPVNIQYTQQFQLNQKPRMFTPFSKINHKNCIQNNLFTRFFQKEKENFQLNKSYLYYPANNNQYYDEIYHIQNHKPNNKSIDWVILKNKGQIFQMNMFNITPSQKQVKIKIINFLYNYLNSQKITITKQNTEKSQLLNQKYILNYIVLSPQPKQIIWDDIKSQLIQRINKQIGFLEVNKQKKNQEQRLMIKGNLERILGLGKSLEFQNYGKFTIQKKVDSQNSLGKLVLARLGSFSLKNDIITQGKSMEHMKYKAFIKLIHTRNLLRSKSKKDKKKNVQKKVQHK